MNEIIKNLAQLGTRQGGQLDHAYKYLCSIFKKENVEYKVQKYKTDMPVWSKYELEVDGVNIPCLPTGLASGNIGNNYAITSSLISSRHFLNISHISFNPKSKSISQANFSFAPSLAISRDFLSKVCSARKIEGKIIVKKKKQNTYQILVGNVKNPKNIIFSHFDSIGSGAIDNASGTALAMEIIRKNKKILKNNLFVFDGNEEISYDYPVYWGKGYRNFEKKYSRQISKAKQLIVVDCIGYDKTFVLSGKSDSKIIKLAFPINNINKYASKIKLITSDYDKLMDVYHSDLDLPKLIKEKYLKEILKKLKNLILFSN